MSRTRRFLGGFTVGYLHMAVATAVGLWLTPFLLGRLGSTTYGLWLVGTQVIAYLLLMDLGIVALLPRETAYVTGRTGRSDVPELRELVERTITLAVAQVPMVVVAVLVTLWWLPASWQQLQAPLTVVLAVFVATFPLRTFQATLVGLQDLAFVAQTQFAAWALGTVLTVVFVLAGFGLPALAAGWCVTQLIAVASCGLRLAQRFPAAMPRRLSFGGDSTRRYLARSLWVAVSQMAQALLNGTDVLIIGALFGPAAVVPYACTGKLIAVLANQPQAILQSAAPALAELRPLADRGRIVQVTSALSQATLAVSGLVACIVLAVNQAFVSWWVGADQFGGRGLTLLMLAAMLVRHFNTTNVYALFCFGHERRLALTTLGDGLVTIGAGIAFVAWFGIEGGPLGALLGVLAVSVPLNLKGLSAETGVAPSSPIASLAPWTFRLGLVTIAAAAAGILLPAPTLPAIACTAGGTALLYIVAVAGPIVRSPAGIYLQPILASVGRRFAPAWLRPRWLS